MFRWEKVVSPLRCNAVRDRISTSSPIAAFFGCFAALLLCTSRAMMMHDFSSSSNHCIPHKIQTSPGGHQSCCYCCCSSLLLDKTPFKKDDSCTCFSSPSSTLDFYPDEAFVHLYEGMNGITGAPTYFRQEFSKNQTVTKGEKTRQSLFTFS